MDHACLTGTWSGAYRYPANEGPETVFTARIEEISGSFTGQTDEPNMFGIGTEAIVTADIDGERHGSEVRFTKFMNGSGGMHHIILYAGAVDDALTHIEGVWSIPGEWSGTFFMSRDETGADEAAKIAVEIDLRSPRR